MNIFVMEMSCDDALLDDGRPCPWYTATVHVTRSLSLLSLVLITLYNTNLAEFLLTCTLSNLSFPS